MTCRWLSLAFRAAFAVSAAFAPFTAFVAVAWLVAPALREAAGQERKEPADGLRQPPQTPQQSLQSFELQRGFRIELVACEPLIQDPVAMAFDERGDLYVVEYPEFNQYQFAAGVGRIGCVKRLRDRDGDGRFDEATVYVEAPFPTAVICYDGGVFVGAPPDILYCKDTDGDGVADEKRIVLSGFGRDFAGGGLLNSFRWGCDNRIHIATGFAGGRVRRADQSDLEALEMRSRGLILDPRTLNFERTSGGGQHGMSMDDWGRKFLCSNVAPLQYLTYDDRYAERNPFFAPPPPARSVNGEDPLAPLGRISPLEPWRIERSRRAADAAGRKSEEARAGGVFTSASGITVYRGDAFPPQFYGNLLVGEVANNLVYRARLDWTGLAPLAHRADADGEFLASRDSWFRPVQLANGPDGALYVVDMYRQLIEGAAFVPRRALADLDASRGIDRGRIYRVIPRDFQRRAAPRLDLLATAELVATLEHPNGWHRETAARLICERQDPAAAAALQRRLATSKAPRARMLALYALESLDQLASEALRSALDDAEARVREHALRLAELRVEDEPTLREALYARTADPDVGVRRQAAFSLGRLSGPRRNARLAALARRDAAYPEMLMAVQCSLAEGSGEVFADLAADPASLAQPPLRQWLLELAAQIGVQSDPSDVACVLKCGPSLSELDRELAEAIQRKLFAGLRRERLGDFDWDAVDSVFEKLLRSAAEIASDDAAPVARRVPAVQTLGLADFNDRQTRAIFRRLLGPEQPRRIQLAACETLARFEQREVADMLLRAWPRMTPEVRGKSVETLLSRIDWMDRFLDAVETGVVKKHDVDPVRMRLAAAQQDNPSQRTSQDKPSQDKPPQDKPPQDGSAPDGGQRVGALQARIERLFPAAGRLDRQSVVDSYQSALELAGDATRGRQVFQRVCASCHRRSGIGVAIGADLKDTARRPPAALLVDILDPVRQMKPQFQNYALQTRDGRALAGMISDETANGIRLRKADGGVEEILRIDIKLLRGTGVSFMPEGLEKAISQQAMADLLAFLAS